MKIHLWKKKSLSYRMDLKGSEKIMFIVAWCNYWLIFYFLSTLYLMFDYLWACISPSDIYHICAKSNGHTLGFISLWLLCSIWPTDRGFTVPHTLLVFLHLPWLVILSLHSESPLSFLFTLQATAERPSYSKSPQFTPISSTWGFLPLRASHHDGASLEVTSIGSWDLSEISYKTRDDSFQSNFLIYQRPSFSKK